MIQLIDINKLKQGDVFYKAEIRGVSKCEMYDDDIQEYGSFAVTINDNSESLRFISKEDYEYLFYTQEEAEEMVERIPNKLVDQLLDDDMWVKELMDKYERSVNDIYVVAMKKAIKIKTGIDI
ncbi:hypothetical protein Curi_c17770 [Gottschalkia acidurici 9a]|uniref:Uncharacterized protein n=1 Tax=Gottschalkia acidurici (strain ATCC 7906 / DSM 604 / BCRC 14475 / CIP 104303 / KCTC 5404 / NCIMB 10678 / 9a) TaxID=1128398 RepID=K0AZS9_GOTA9|nr:hypothetical protein [Gottschalkia acidurici]AFS78784.1 hypothetical protein Curi_c17770 [Gottschalkia acidurici 9a]